MALQSATREEWKRLRSWYPSYEPVLNHTPELTTDRLSVKGRVIGQVTYCNKRDGTPSYEVEGSLLVKMRGKK